MCLYPTLIKNRKYTDNKKNGGNIPTVKDERTRYVPVGCQDCIECRKQKARAWQVRLLEDIKTNTHGKFITFTFSNEWIKNILEGWVNSNGEYIKGINEEEPTPTGYELDNAIATRGMRLFLERWRKEYKKSLRHWCVTELGHNGTENIHIHGIVWPSNTEEWKNITKIWQYGWVWTGKETNRGNIENYVNGRTVSYIVKYVMKMDEKHKGYRSKILTSPGIGNNYTNTYDAQNNTYKGPDTNQLYRTSTGHKIAMPIYWRNKIYTEEEREKLWIQMLDKNERWVRGEKIDITNGFETYDKIVNWHRKMNKELGYGDGTTTEEQLKYERDRRNLMIKTRLANARTKGQAQAAVQAHITNTQTQTCTDSPASSG